ncbi:cell wall-active antibiotics response protein LiaF [Ornithinibacillus halophilus]|uniref:Lia operon protein LiaF n=1 Tax=Ornithinibacillus halophilus TaxID=930117 RepID=A0A1M5F603_9BACI|nr:cell wall-active antibiotics response protein LiaF [Ornithinibacillus halophilus]SHF86973.1 lia operon protein LiaF [Ornithinibacillus halophilus]
MFHRLSTDHFNWILIIGVILFIIEVAFFHGGMIYSALISGILIYVGWKNFFTLWGKILFWIGVVSGLLSIFNMLAVRFLIVVAIVLFVLNYLKSKQEDETIIPNLPNHQEVIVDSIIKVEPLFDHTLFGEQQTEETAYQWRDINIHALYGDRTIDLSNTVLPNDTSVISIRQGIGNITIYVPYELDVSIHHSSVFGRAHILGKHHWKLMNQSLFYQTEGYDHAVQRVKIITSVFSGDIEVKRI